MRAAALVVVVCSVCQLEAGSRGRLRRDNSGANVEYTDITEDDTTMRTKDESVQETTKTMDKFSSAKDLALADERHSTEQSMREKEIEHLEQEKGALYARIQTALDESEAALGRSNTSEAARGLRHVSQLRTQLAQLNATDSIEDVTYDARRAMVRAGDTAGSGRKAMKKTERKKEPLGTNNLAGDLAAYISQQKEHKNWREKMINKERVRGEVQQWIAEREQARVQKVREKRVKVKRGPTEECPRYGSKSSKKKKGQSGYPCCRKCCKQSYMGCL